MIWILLSLVAVALSLGWIVQSRQLHRWLGGYVIDSLKRRSQKPTGCVDLLVCVADHFEPLWGNMDEATGDVRMKLWMSRFPALAEKHRDSDGCAPKHTFFFPGEQYRERWIAQLAELTRAELGEVEIHLHHKFDTAAGVREKLIRFRDQLASHGLLSTTGRDAKPQYAFIHGDWALANSGAGPESCGVDDELPVLVETGCYADLTFPSAPSSTQIFTINRIFYADPKRVGPRPHERGVEARVRGVRAEELLLIEGPLLPDWERRKWGVLPRIENSDLSGSNPPDLRRVPLWLTADIHVLGRPEWKFLKLHTHGGAERNHEALMGDPYDRFLTDLETNYNDGRRFRLHYVTAREMFNIAMAAMEGREGNAGEYRDYRLIPRWRKGSHP